MTNESRHSNPAVQTALSWWHSVRGRWQRLHELDDLSTDELDRLACDVGLDANELKRVVQEPDGVPVLLGRRLIALDLDASQIRALAPLMMRDLERTCATCGDKKRCSRDFDMTDKPADWERYCPNAATLRSLY
ncbi:MAG TPA: hypothetical protein PK970_06820 [Hyphomicrobiaceae bacterium]|nr:hypothetical protein [Hyphomicrobiaceae bacterium]